MKKTLFFLIIIASGIGCKKDIVGTFTGEKITNYSFVNYIFRDTITIEFDGSKYTYSGKTYTHPPDLGSGMYLIKHDSIRFIDEVARNASLTWDWIIGGNFKITMTNDSMILNQDHYGIIQTCRLKKIK